MSCLGAYDGLHPEHDPHVVVRLARPADLPDVVGLIDQIMVYHAAPPPYQPDLLRVVNTILDDQTDTEAQEDSRPETLPGRVPHHLFLVAEDGNRVVGMCALIFSFSTWSAAPVCELQDVFVAEASRGRGVGRALLGEARRVALRYGCRRLFLSAESFNLPAHAFYRALGFQEKTSLHFELTLPNDQ